MKLKRVKGGKGPRWKKHQSCVSNALTTKFRDSAKGRFFQEINDSGLTLSAVEKHNIALAESSVQKLTTEDVDIEDYQSVGKSFNTFATNFTTCTIPAFERFFERFSIKSSLHTNMLAIHAAAQEYIQEAELPETSTSYLCALIISLEGIKDSEDDAAAVLSLMAKVIRKIPNDILVLKFAHFSASIFEVLRQYESSQNIVLLSCAIGCLSVILRAQPKLQWEFESTKNIFNSIRHYTLHPNPKIRRASHYNITAILRGSSSRLLKEADDYMMNDFEIEKTVPFEPHPCADSIGHFLKDELQLSSQSLNSKTTLYLLAFAQQVLSYLPEKPLRQVSERVLGVMYIGDSLIKSCALKIFRALFMKNGSTSLSEEILEALFNAFTLSGGAMERCLVPSMNDYKLASMWIKACTSGVARYLRFNKSMGVKYIVKWIEQITSFWKSSFEAIHEEVFFSIEFLLDKLEEIEKDTLSNYSNEIEIIFNAIENGLSLQFREAWPYVLRTMAAFFKSVGSHVPKACIGSLQNLSELYEDPKFPCRPLLEHSIGNAITTIGPVRVMETLPLRITGDVVEDEKNMWILPILKRYVKDSQLCFFIQYFVKVADMCLMEAKKHEVAGQKESITCFTYKNLEKQIWSLFQSFAINATDIDEALTIENSLFPKRVHAYIKDREDVRLDMLSGLRSMIESSRERKTKLSVFSKNFMPILFNLYMMPVRIGNADVETTIISGQRTAVYVTIKLFLTITPTEIRGQLYKGALKKYQDEIVPKLKELSSSQNIGKEERFEEKQAELKSRCLLDIIRTYLPYLSKSELSELKNIFTPYIIHSKDNKQQKGAYRMLEELLGLTNDVGIEFIKENFNSFKDTLLKSMKAAASNVRPPRLRCLSELLTYLPSGIKVKERTVILRQCVAEAILCFGTSNSTPAQKAAIRLISEVGLTMQRATGASNEEVLDETLVLLLAGFVANSPLVIANTIRAVMVLSCKYKDIMPPNVIQNLLSNIPLLLSRDDRAITNASLSFLLLMFRMFPVAVMSNHVDFVVENLVKMTPDCRKKNRMKLRDFHSCLIRKFGADRIMALLVGDVISHKCVKNVIKIEARKKRDKLAAKGNNESSKEKVERTIPLSFDELLEEIDREIEDDVVQPDTDGEDSKKDKKRKKRKEMWIREDEDEIVDLLDSTSGQISSKPLKSDRGSATSTQNSSSADCDKFGVKFDKKTKKIVVSGNVKDSDSVEVNSDEDIPDLDGLFIGESKSSLKLKKRKRTVSEDSLDEKEPWKPYLHSKMKKKKKVTFDYGSEFRSKKAGGDVAKKNGVAPYAYVPMSKEKLNKRKQAKFKGQFKSLVRGAKKGASKGTKNKKSKHSH